MDPNIALILTALVSGAQGVASEAVKDAYHCFKTLIQRKFTGHKDEQSAQVALSKYEEKPEIWKEPLKDILIQVKASEDQTIIEAATELIKLLQSKRPDESQNIIHNSGTIHSTNQGDYNTNIVTLNFNEAAPRKA